MLRGRRVSVFRVPPVRLAAFSLPATFAAQTAQGGSTKSDIWGTVPAWLSAVLTGLAFGVTFMLFLWGRRDRIRRQAERVYAWETQTTDRDGSSFAIATIYNTSEEPIWDLEVFPRRFQTAYLDVTVEPGATDMQPDDRTFWTWPLPQDHEETMDRHPMLLFTDSANRRWKKVGGRLKRWRRGRR